jgi:hypothetical protein
MTNLITGAQAPQKTFPVMTAAYDCELNGPHLWMKYGFGDGDVLLEYTWIDKEIEDFAELLYKRGESFFDDFNLLALVELYLLPKFDRPLTLHYASYSHNGARVLENEWWDVKDYTWAKANLPTVKIPGHHVLETMWSMKMVLEQWMRKERMTFPEQLRQTAQIMAYELKAEVLIGDQLYLPNFDDEDDVCSYQPPSSAALR